MLIRPKTSLLIEVARSRMGLFTRRRLRLIVAKAASGALPNAAWLAWPPLLRNTISWSETYGVYAAPAPNDAGQLIVPVATRYPAAERAIHPYLAAGFAAPVPDNGVPQRHYDVRNDSAFTAAFGLVQAASVNGLEVLAAVNLIVLPPCAAADFTSQTDLYVWAAPDVSSGTTAAVAPEHAIRIPLSSSGQRAKYYYGDLFTVHKPTMIEDEASHNDS